MNAAVEQDLPADEQQEIARVSDAITPLLMQANEITVASDEDDEAAATFLSRLAGEKKHADSARRFLVDPLNAHVNAINAQFKGPAAIIEEASSVVRAKILAYRQERERARQAEIRRLQQEAQAKWDRERAEQLEQERAAAATAARAAEAARLIEHAANAEAADTEAAEAARAAQEFAARTAALEQQRATVLHPIAEPVIAPLPQRTHAAAATRKRWTATVTDPAQVPREYLVVDQRLINAAVKQGVREIPGVRIEHVPELAVRAS